MRIVLLLTILCLTGTLKGQSDFDERLLVKFNEERITQLQKEHPQIIAFMEFYLENGISIVSLNNGKQVEIEGTLKLKSLDESKVNVYDLGIPLPLEQTVYYSIEGTDKTLLVYSRTLVMNKFNNLKK
jgi:hypothetical protein